GDLSFEETVPNLFRCGRLENRGERADPDPQNPTLHLTSELVFQPMFERESEAKFLSINDFCRKQATQSADQKRFRSAPSDLPTAWSGQYPASQHMVYERNSCFEAMRHAHHVGISQQCV